MTHDRSHSARQRGLRLVELASGEVLVTYVATRHDGSRFQNTEIVGVRGDQIVRWEVYFGWDL